MSRSDPVGIEVLYVTEADRDSLERRDTFPDKGLGNTLRSMTNSLRSSMVRSSKDDILVEQNNIYTIQVNAGQHLYTIARSYKAFAIFAMQLHRKYARSQLPVLPDLKQSSRQNVNQYIASLLELPEIVQSDTLLSFLDEESNEGEFLDFDTLHLDSASPIDIILEKEPHTKKAVMAGREHKVERLVEGGSVVVWEFSTRKRDIGFSVIYNDTEVKKYQRLESHEKNISGLFEVPSTAIDRLGQPCDEHRVVLKFDNSYSKLRAKNLVYRVHHVSPKIYTDAVEAANVITKKKSEFAHQRQLVKAGLADLGRNLIIHSGQSTVAMLTGVQSMESNTQESANPIRSTDTQEGKEIQERLQAEKASLAAAYEDALNALEEERNATANAIGKMEAAVAQVDALEEELLAAREEIELMKDSFVEKEKMHASILDNIRSQQELAMESLERSKEHEHKMQQAQIARSQQEELIENLQLQLSKMSTTDAAHQEQIKILKGERKQLKKYAIQAKSDIERLQSNQTLLEKEVSALQSEVKDGKEDFQTVVTELKQARAHLEEAGLVHLKPNSGVREATDGWGEVDDVSAQDGGASENDKGSAQRPQKLLILNAAITSENGYVDPPPLFHNNDGTFFGF